jgi:hypothetical protein
MLARSQTALVQPFVHFIRSSTLCTTTGNLGIETGATITVHCSIHESRNKPVVLFGGFPSNDKTGESLTSTRRDRLHVDADVTGPARHC